MSVCIRSCVWVSVRVCVRMYFSVQLCAHTYVHSFVPASGCTHARVCVYVFESVCRVRPCMCTGTRVCDRRGTYMRFPVAPPLHNVTGAVSFLLPLFDHWVQDSSRPTTHRDGKGDSVVGKTKWLPCYLRGVSLESGIELGLSILLTSGCVVKE